MARWWARDLERPISLPIRKLRASKFTLSLLWPTHHKSTTPAHPTGYIIRLTPGVWSGYPLSQLNQAQLYTWFSSSRLGGTGKSRCCGHEDSEWSLSGRDQRHRQRSAHVRARELRRRLWYSRLSYREHASAAARGDSEYALSQCGHTASRAQLPSGACRFRLAGPAHVRCLARKRSPRRRANRMAGMGERTV